MSSEQPNCSKIFGRHTVNIISRIDSTGGKGRIQVPERVVLALKDKYDFELRDENDVKGRSRIKTDFLKPK